MVEPQDAALAQRVAGGDSQAETELFLRFGEPIKLMVQARLKRKVPLEDREDLVSEIQQATLLSLRRGGYDPAAGKSLGAYIAGIASNVVGQYFRKKQKAGIVESGLMLEAPADSPDKLSELLDEERHATLRRCLGRLKPQYKEVLLLRIYEQRSIEEIAAQLNLDRRRVSERIHYAFKLLIKECQRDDYFSALILLL
jgi:RNA polymerase sigma-70 factor (ECF subfamily)